MKKRIARKETTIDEEKINEWAMQYSFRENSGYYGNAIVEQAVGEAYKAGCIKAKEELIKWITNTNIESI